MAARSKSVPHPRACRAHTAFAIVWMIALAACSSENTSAPNTGARTSTFPPGWGGGSSNKSYEFGLDRGNVHGGGAAAYIASVVANPTGFASLTQSIRADAYRGRRVRWSDAVR